MCVIAIQDRDNVLYKFWIMAPSYTFGHEAGMSVLIYMDVSVSISMYKQWNCSELCVPSVPGFGYNSFIIIGM
jgi:hypothetical protein